MKVRQREFQWLVLQSRHFRLDVIRYSMLWETGPRKAVGSWDTLEKAIVVGISKNGHGDLWRLMLHILIVQMKGRVEKEGSVHHQKGKGSKQRH